MHIEEQVIKNKPVIASEDYQLCAEKATMPK
jgi:hypothetical protein